MKLFTYTMLFLLLTVCSAEEVKMDGAPRGRLLSSKLKNLDGSIMTKRRELEDSRRNLGCKDTDKGLKDSYGDGCEWYDDYPLGCGNYDVSGGFRANAMCCSCGGGAQTEERCTITQTHSGVRECKWNYIEQSDRNSLGYLGTWEECRQKCLELEEQCNFISWGEGGWCHMTKYCGEDEPNNNYGWDRYEKVCDKAGQ